MTLRLHSDSASAKHCFPHATKWTRMSTKTDTLRSNPIRCKSNSRITCSLRSKTRQLQHQGSDELKSKSATALLRATSTNNSFHLFVLWQISLTIVRLAQRQARTISELKAQAISLETTPRPCAYRPFSPIVTCSTAESRSSSPWHSLSMATRTNTRSLRRSSCLETRHSTPLNRRTTTDIHIRTLTVSCSVTRCVAFHGLNAAATRCDFSISVSAMRLFVQMLHFCGISFRC